MYVAREDFGTPFLLRTATLGALNRLMEARGARIAPSDAGRAWLTSPRSTKMQAAMEAVMAANCDRADGIV